MTRAEVTAEVLAAKRPENLTFTELAERSGEDREAESGPRVRIILDGKWLPYPWQA